MMLLISMAITLAFVASAATTLGLFDLDFWWELALLVTIMLLGHWMEMRAVGQASGALEALAALLPDEAEKVTDGTTEKVSLEDLGEGNVVLVRSVGRVPADGEIVEGEAELDESMLDRIPVAYRQRHLEFREGASCARLRKTFGVRLLPGAPCRPAGAS
jgi:Cu2+-exporting ATPase